MYTRTYMRFVQICAQRFKLNVLITFGCTQMRCEFGMRSVLVLAAVDDSVAGKFNGP